MTLNFNCRESLFDLTLGAAPEVRYGLEKVDSGLKVLLLAREERRLINRKQVCVRQSIKHFALCIQGFFVQGAN
jgi:hypothetical protein